MFPFLFIFEMSNKLNFTCFDMQSSLYKERMQLFYPHIGYKQWIYLDYLFIKVFFICSYEKQNFYREKHIINTLMPVMPD